MFPEATQFPGFTNEEMPFQYPQNDRFSFPYIGDMAVRNYIQLNNFNHLPNTYQLLDSLNAEKKPVPMDCSIGNVKQEYDENINCNASNPVGDFSTTNVVNTEGGNFIPTTSAAECAQGNGQKKKQSKRSRIYKFNPKPLTLNPQMKRTNTPNDNKNDEYWEKRKKNNEASRRSRLARRLKECMVMEEMKKLRKENEQLKAELIRMQSLGVCRL